MNQVSDIAGDVGKEYSILGARILVFCFFIWLSSNSFSSFFLFHGSALDNRPKSSSPIRLPEISGGQTNRTVEAEPQPSKILKASVMFIHSLFIYLCVYVCVCVCVCVC